MADIQKMLEQKEKLQQKIKEEKKREYEKFGRWFFNKLNVNRSADAKKIINEKILNSNEYNEPINVDNADYKESNETLEKDNKNNDKPNE